MSALSESKSAARCGFEDLAERINEEHRLARENAESAIDHALRVGDLLLEAKAKVPHGKWLPWLRENVKFSERTSQSYMRLVAKKETVLANIADEDDGISVRRALGVLRKPLHPQYEEEQETEQQQESALAQEEAKDALERQKTMFADQFDGDGLRFGEYLITRPFSGDDVAGEHHEWRSGFVNKLLYQATLPAIAGFALGCLDEYDPIPMLRMVPAYQIAEALSRLVPLATGKTVLPMEVATRRHANLILNGVELEANYFVAALVKEIRHREAVDDETFEAERQKVSQAFLDTAKARVAGLEQLKERRKRGDFKTPEEYWGATEKILRISLQHDWATVSHA